jgi:single-stranded DNA-binding protein
VRPASISAKPPGTAVWHSRSSVNFAATLSKGAHLMIEGDVRTREYVQKTGGKKPTEVKKSITEVRVTSISKLDRGARSGAAANGAGQEVSA